MKTFSLQNIKSEEFQTISSEEIKKLFLEGTKEAKEKIFKSNIPLVKYVLGEFSQKITNQNYEDMFQEALVGLLKAIKEFNLDYNVEFSTYAVPMIKGEIQRYLRDKSYLIKPSRKATYLKYRVALLIDAYEKKYGKQISTKMLSTLLNTSESEIAQAISSNDILSFDVNMNSSSLSADNKCGLENLISYDYDDMSLVETKLVVEKVLNKYPNERKEAIIQYYTGFITQTELAEKLSLSQAQVSRILRGFKRELLKELEYNPMYVEENSKIKRVKQTIYDKISFYDKKMIDETIDEIFTDDEKEILFCFYPKSIKELKKTIQSENIKWKAYILIEKLVEKMALKVIENGENMERENKTKRKNNYNIEDDFVGYSKESVLSIINVLPQKKKEIMEYLYGVNGKSQISIKEIAEVLNLNYSNVYQAAVNTKKFVIDILSGKKTLKLQKGTKINQDKKDNFFNEFEGYTKEEVLKAIDELSCKNKLIIECYYGLNGKEKKSIDEIAASTGIKSSSMYTTNYNIKKQIKGILNGEKKLKLQKENKYVNKKTKSINFKEMLDSLDECALDLIISNLSEKQIIAFKDYYYNKLTIEEIALKLNITVNTTKNYISMCQSEIKKYLKQISEEKNEEANKQLENKKITITKKEIKKEKCINDIGEIYDLIKDNNKEILNTKYILNNSRFLVVSKTVSKCKLSNADVFFGNIYEKGSITKKCYVYRITEIDKDNNIIDEKILVRDTNIKKFYNCVKKDENGRYDFTNIENDEIVCYEITDEKEIENFEEKKTDIKNESLNSYINNLFKQAAELQNGTPFQLTESLEIYKKLLNMTQDNYLLYCANYNIASIYQKRGKLQLAEKYYKETLKYNSDYNVLCELGENYIIQERYEEALKTFSECGKVDYKKNYHKSKIALCYHFLGKDDMAFSLLNESIDKNEKDYDAFYTKALIFFDSGNYLECLEELKNIEGNKITPNILRKMSLEGKALYLLGKKDEAIKEFDFMVAQDIEHNSSYNIRRIGLFFHELGEKDLAYKYYLQVPRFEKWVSLTREEINDHFIKHKQELDLDDMHSVFNEDITIEELDKLISNIEKTDVRILYDVYQIKWPNIGYMNPSGEKIDLDYISIFTLPFTKKIMMAYPDFELKNKCSKPMSIDEIRKQNNSITEENESEEQIINKDNLYYVDKDDFDKKTKANKSYNDFHYEVFKQNKDSVRLLINNLTDSKTQVLLLLALGYVDDKMYTIEELSEMFKVDSNIITKYLNSGLDMITKFASNILNSTGELSKKLMINKRNVNR